MNSSEAKRPQSVDKKELSLLKQEKEDLRDYYQTLKERRDRIIALKKIKDAKRRQRAINDENSAANSYALKFQDGEFKSKRSASGLLPASGMMEDNVEQHSPRKPISRTPIPEPVFVPTPKPKVVVPQKEEQPMFKNTDDYIKKPLKTTDFVIEDEPFLPPKVEELHVEREELPPRNLTKSIPDIIEPSLGLTKVLETPEQEEEVLPPPPIEQPAPAPYVAPIQQPMMQQAVATPPPVIEPAKHTNVYEPDSAMVLDPFDKVKSEREIAEDAHSLMPKNSPLYIASICILTTMLGILLTIVLIWGFATNWTMDIKTFGEAIKNFFTI